MTRVPMPSSDPELQARYRDVLRDRPSAGEHPSEETWVRLSCDELSADEQARLADHVVACAECAEVFRAVGDVRAGAAVFDADAPPAAAVVTSARPGWFQLAAAAAVLLALGSAAWWQQAAGRDGGAVAQVDSPSAAPTAAATATPAAVSGAPGSAPTPPAPLTPSWAALPAAPAVSLPFALTLVVRGAPAEREAFMRAFGAAIAPYRESRYAEAAAALEGVTRQFPGVAEGWFYLGAARLLAERPGDAVEPLRRARGSEVVADDARWLEAVALARAGRADEATTALQAMCDGRGSHRAAACDAMRAGR